MELISLFLLSFGVGFSGAMMPGPLLAVGIAETPRSGWMTGVIISIGHSIAEIGVVLVLAIGLVAVTDNSIVPKIIGVVGGTALLWMGAKMAWDILRGNISYDADTTNPTAHHRLAAKGITATLSNPFWFVWWATTGLAFVTKSLKFGIAGPVVFYFGHIMSDFVWYTVVSILVWKGKSLMVGTGLKVLILICAAFLLWLGVTFIIDGVRGTL
ncbi:MAG: LysE family translocator [candidate division Zixibacteria bacterium]|nr:LysE family translocator [candidate division Zixibacteria bacterium]